TSSKTVADDWYYVLISRAKTKVTLFTDSIKKLPKSISKRSQKHAAIELEHSKSSKLINRIEKFSGKSFSMD
ncbi:hypothetical protein, partial [Klebsiella pneumoniae]